MKPMAFGKYRAHPQMGLWLGDNELLVDNFAGGGGASTGIEMALGRPVDIAINHDAVALCGNSVSPPMAAALVRANMAGVKQAGRQWGAVHGA